ncbi:hypothetical protein NDU88_006871 [Pleurodeles waltl]|uniref:Uncharacterized protein n=1 Tax=Pleurodeles waltl TaxID=8319 RepID=A0AAV7UMB7_PLEWA|nr:hypothetical protein NDU88_006871 [Pleurodeles waltl]
MFQERAGDRLLSYSHFRSNRAGGLEHGNWDRRSTSSLRSRCLISIRREEMVLGLKLRLKVIYKELLKVYFVTKLALHIGVKTKSNTWPGNKRGFGDG